MPTCSLPLPSPPREALELAGISGEAVTAELEAKERAKQRRLYGSSLSSGDSAAAAPAEAPPPEPERGSAGWLAAQAAWEDAHLGGFDRILPPADPALATLYEELQAGARQVFRRQTMLGRNQQRIGDIR